MREKLKTRSSNCKGQLVMAKVRTRFYPFVIVAIIFAESCVRPRCEAFVIGVPDGRTSEKVT